MIREFVQHDTTVFQWVLGTPKKKSENEQILNVLARAAEDDGFIAQLTFQGSNALQNYDLSQQAKAAIISGDRRWIEARVGKLPRRLRTWIDCRLQQEIW